MLGRVLGRVRWGTSHRARQIFTDILIKAQAMSVWGRMGRKRMGEGKGTRGGI